MLAVIALIALTQLPMAEADKPLWVLERVHATRVAAHTFGDSAYNRYKANTTLTIACTKGIARLSVSVDVKGLGFDSNPYEGPDATKNGPLVLTTGQRPPVSHGVSGSWGVGSLYQVGPIFVFDAAVPSEELATWLADGTSGQIVRGELGGMTFTFKWPSNVEALRAACTIPRNGPQ